MSDNLMYDEGSQEYAMIYAAEYGKPWHDKGRPVSKDITFEDAIATAHLDYQVELVQAQAIDDGKIAPKHKIIRRSDNHAILGVVGSRYTPIQNTDAFRLFNPLLEKKMLQLEAAGAFGIGERMWVLGRIGESYEVVRGDEVQPFILFSNAHDGSRGLLVLNTSVRVVCQNTESAAIEGRNSELTINIRHTSGAETKIDEAGAVVARAIQYHESFKEAAHRLAMEKVTRADLHRVLEQVFPMTKNPETGKMEYSTRTQNSMETIEVLFDNEAIEGAMGTKWAAYNAVTAYTDHFRTAQSSTHLESIWLGSGADLKKKVFSLLVA